MEDPSTDSLTEARIALLNNYSAEVTTHGTYIVATVVLFFSWVIAAHSLGIFLEIFGGSAILTVLTYLLLRTMYWSYLSTRVISLGYYIVDGKISFDKITKELGEGNHTTSVEKERRMKAIEDAKEIKDPLLLVSRTASPSFYDEPRLYFRFLVWTHRRRRYLASAILFAYAGWLLVLLISLDWLALVGQL